jgi:LmbE family N-acetylglucosaminyl deacetylase
MEKLKVTAVGAHPDDLEIFAGGTLAKYVETGNDVTMVYVTNGNMGHVSIKPEELARIRKAEAHNASKVIGGRFIWLGLPDEWVFHNQETRLRFVDVIREAKPDVIITHDPGDYHPDHVAVSNLVFAASFLSTVPNIKTSHDFVERAPVIYYMDTYAGLGFMPDRYVNIGKQMEKKLEALSQHRSQIEWLKKHDKIDIMDYVRTAAKLRGYQAGADFAEGFKRIKNRPGPYTLELLP